MSTWQLRKPYFHGPGEHIVEFTSSSEKLVLQVDENRYFDAPPTKTFSLGIFAKLMQ